MKQNRENQIQREKKKNKKAERKRQKKNVYTFTAQDLALRINFYCISCNINYMLLRAYQVLENK